MELTSTVARKARANISFFDLKAQFAKMRIEILQAVETVLESQNFILGQQVELFEKEAAAFLEVPHAVGCASGTDALYLALCAQGIGPGDEVITTPFTFVATAGSIVRTGAKPVFVDILPETFNINPALIEQAVSSNTKAIIPVHLFGLSADMDPIIAIAKKHSLAVIEDAAQAIGTTYHGKKIGSIGDFGCFSFFPSKNLGCAGDGGMVTTQHKAMADRLNLLRAHGTRKKYHSEIIGMNSRLDALQAAILRVKLRHLDSWTKNRQERASLYAELFDQYKLANVIVAPQAPPQFGHVYNQYVIRTENRDSLRDYLQDQGIPTAIYYPEPLHLQPAFDYLKYAKGSMPESEKACDDSLALPVYPELPLEDQERVVQAIADFYKSKVQNTRGNVINE
jgi:dTDP-4-amino-4,6-dideoxygalactose transaminase